MRLKVQITGSVNDILREERRKGGTAVQRAMASVSTEIKLAWRGQISGAGLGTRLANTVRSEVYPRSIGSLRAAAEVWSKAPHIVGAFERGAVIRANNGFWLAIPLPAAGTGASRGRLTPGEWERRRGLKLRFVYRRGGTSLLVADGRQNKRGLGVESRSRTGRGRATVPIFALVPQVTLRKRLDLYRDAARLAGSLPARIVGNWK
jgi:Family of unknown function (DUF6441)